MISGTNVIRIIRIIAGLGFVVYGLTIDHYLLSFLGALISVQGVLNPGCPFNSCTTPIKKDDRKIQDIEYEDISK